MYRHVSRDARKPVFKVSDQVRRKPVYHRCISLSWPLGSLAPLGLTVTPAYTVTDSGLKLEILDLRRRGIVLSVKRSFTVQLI